MENVIARNIESHLTLKDSTFTVTVVVDGKKLFTEHHTDSLTLAAIVAERFSEYDYITTGNTEFSVINGSMSIEGELKEDDSLSIPINDSYIIYYYNDMMSNTVRKMN